MRSRQQPSCFDASSLVSICDHDRYGPSIHPSIPFRSHTSISICPSATTLVSLASQPHHEPSIVSSILTCSQSQKAPRFRSAGQLCLSVCLPSFWRHKPSSPSSLFFLHGGNPVRSQPRVSRYPPMLRSIEPPCHQIACHVPPTVLP